MLAERLTGTRIFRHLPLGIDEFVDVKSRFPSHDFACFVDVGANVGQSALNIRRHFPRAEIHSLEPVAATFALLERNTRAHGIHVHQLALGAANGELEARLQGNAGHSDLNTLVGPDRTEGRAEAGTRSEIVRVETLETFCLDAGISRIDFLKIDTEGFDLEVLKGAGPWLDEQRIPLVLVEVSMNRTNTFHVAFDDVKRFMEERAYHVFGLYEQTHEWKTNKPILRRANVLFVSGQMAGLKKQGAAGASNPDRISARGGKAD